MNIFLTDKSPKRSAMALDDKRVLKMILESAQMLSTAVYTTNPEVKLNLYQPTHENHPCTQWVKKSRIHYRWLLLHLDALLIEYKRRFKKEHETKKLLPHLVTGYNYIANNHQSPPPNVTNYDTGDIFLNYRLHLIDKWKQDDNPKWTRRGEPEWRIEMEGIKTLKEMLRDKSIPERRARLILRASYGNNKKRRWVFKEEEQKEIMKLIEEGYAKYIHRKTEINRRKGRKT